MESSTFRFTDADGFSIFVRRWRPDAGVSPRGVVQIAHGAAEHSARYQRLAEALTADGWVVYADDHRGHGETAGSLERAGHAGVDGWNGMVRDLKQLSDIARGENPGLPLVLIGHSMGSLLAQQYVQHWGEDLRGVVLSGSFGSLPDLDQVLELVEPLGRGGDADEPSHAFAAMFASFNQPFGGDTGFEWLSRDAEEVRRYVDDPYCGFPFSNRLVADQLRGAAEIWKAENEMRIPHGLPVLVISGDRDPVGGPEMSSLHFLVARYRARGLEVTALLYPDARHELFNETNRERVQADLLAWLRAVWSAA